MKKPGRQRKQRSTVAHKSVTHTPESRTSMAKLFAPMLLFAMQPLVAKGCQVAVYLEEQPWFPDGGTQFDFFMYGKAIVFLILVVWMLAVLVDKIVLQGERNLPWKKFRPLFLYGVLVILSTVLSIDKNLSIHGMWEQYETVWVLLGYLIAVFYCFCIVQCKRDGEMLLGALTVGAGLQGILGIFQLLGHDFWSSSLGKSILMAGFDSGLKEKLVFSFEESAAKRK